MLSRAISLKWTDVKHIPKLVQIKASAVIDVQYSRHCLLMNMFRQIYRNKSIYTPTTHIHAIEYMFVSSQNSHAEILTAMPWYWKGKPLGR